MCSACTGWLPRRDHAASPGAAANPVIAFGVQPSDTLGRVARPRGRLDMTSSARSRLEELWDAHCAVPFPQELYSEPGGVEMVLVDAFIAGCASSVLHSGKFSETGHAQALRDAPGVLRTVLPLLLSAEARVYCERLSALAEAALDLQGEA